MYEKVFIRDVLRLGLAGRSLRSETSRADGYTIEDAKKGVLVTYEGESMIISPSNILALQPIDAKKEG